MGCKDVYWLVLPPPSPGLLGSLKTKGICDGGYWRGGMKKFQGPREDETCAERDQRKAARGQAETRVKAPEAGPVPLRGQSAHVIGIDLERFHRRHVKLFLLHKGMLNASFPGGFEDRAIVNRAAAHLG